jgi:putative oxidoreductase
MKLRKLFSWIFQITAAAILLQTLYFKFSGHPESVELFTKLGVEPWGRIMTGIFELIAGILLLTPQWRIYGALLSIGLMIGALISHFFIIGIESHGDGGQLFTLAIIVLISSFLVVLLNKSEVLGLMRKLKF